jgi:hypothetical protein
MYLLHTVLNVCFDVIAQCSARALLLAGGSQFLCLCILLFLYSYRVRAGMLLCCMSCDGIACPLQAQLPKPTGWSVWWMIMEQERCCK